MALKMNLEDSKKVFFYIKIPVHKESQATNYIGKSKRRFSRCLYEHLYYVTSKKMDEPSALHFCQSVEKMEKNRNLSPYQHSKVGPNFVILGFRGKIAVLRH